MLFFNASHLLCLGTELVFAVSMITSSSPLRADARQAIAPAAATSGAMCAVGTPTSTLDATEGALSTALATAAATIQVTTEATEEATQEADAPIHYLSFTPTDIHFNPTVDAPFAVITVYSLVFRNQLGTALHFEHPRFELAINGVEWGTLVSTDSQTGQLLGHASYGIALQNLLIVAKATPEQQAILGCLKTHQPVDLTLTGSLEVFPDGNKQSVPVTLFSRQIVLREHQ